MIATDKTEYLDYPGNSVLFGSVTSSIKKLGGQIGS